MRMICAWCKKVIQKGPEKPVSHGMCRRCARRMEREHEASCGFIRDPSSYVMDKVIVSAIFAAFLLLTVLLVEGLHWITGGKTPSFLERDSLPLHGKPLSESAAPAPAAEPATPAQ